MHPVLLNNIWKKTLLSLGLLFLCLPAWAEWFEYESQIFGTRFSLELWSEDQAIADQVINEVVAEMWRLHHMLSPYEPESELSAVNRLAFSEPVVVSSELFTLLQQSLYYSRLTAGAFDPSFSSIGQYYDYRAGRKPDQSLDEEQIEEAKAAIDFRLIRLDKSNKTVAFEHSAMMLDLGGIAKGYAMDRAADILMSGGIRHASVSAGGDMRILGDQLIQYSKPGQQARPGQSVNASQQAKSGQQVRPDESPKQGRPWIIGIRNPRQESTAIRLPLENTAVSTSGDYERFFIDEDTGDRIHHILDPETGESAAMLASVTVLGEKGLDTDPLSTAVFVLGAEKGLALINSMPEYDAILIDTSGQVHFSRGLVEP